MTASATVSRASQNGRGVSELVSVEPATAAAIRVTEWQPHAAPREISLADAVYASGVVCFEVSIEADPRGVMAALAPVCGSDLDLDMVEDLLDPDPLPKVRRYRDKGDVRSVSAFGVEAVDGAEHDSDTKAGALVFDLVECLAGDRWLVMCCHEAPSYAGRQLGQPTTVSGCKLVLRGAEERWTDGEYKSAGDLGVLVLHELAETYAGAYRGLERWLEQWDLGFFRGDHEVDRKTLIDLRGLIAEFRQRLNAMNVNRHDAGTCWFNDISDAEEASQVDEMTDDALTDMKQLAGMLTNSFELMHSQTTARQLEIAQKQQEGAERLQMRIELVTSLFLVPTLIAGVFGANTALPGGNDPNRWLGFELMVGAMVIGGISVFLLMRYIRRQSERDDEAAVR